MADVIGMDEIRIVNNWKGCNNPKCDRLTYNKYCCQACADGLPNEKKLSENFFSKYGPRSPGEHKRIKKALYEKMDS